VDLARAAAERGARAVVAAGGDGTVHEVANGLLVAAGRSGRVTPLGVVPTGTGNDFVKTLEGGADRGWVYDALASNRTRAFDVGRVEWDGASEYFVNSMGTGVDVEVVREIERLPHLPGLVGYLVGLLRGLRRFSPVPLRLRLDGRTLERTVLIVAVGNGPCLGGGFYLCPGARPDDGRFDLCIVNELGALQIARTIPRVLRGTHPRSPGVEIHRARSVEIEARDGGPLAFQLDGELREAPAARRLRIGIEAGRLPVLAAGLLGQGVSADDGAGRRSGAARLRGGGGRAGA
ncbi:MAG: diacylglycerol/lipid kinase family protein, partial [Gemmatimonadota bacterium]